MFMMHGYPKLTAGPELWEKLGGSMGFIGINFWPIFWGFMAAITEFAGGLLFVIGFMFRPASLLLFIVMLIASIHHFKSGDGIMEASHAIESASLFLGFLFIGPGTYSFDKK